MPRKDCPNVLPLEGEIDLHISPNVTASLSMMIEKKPKQLIVDLSRVTYIDSSGLAALIEGMQNTEEYGGKFALAGLPETIRTIMLGLEQNGSIAQAAWFALKLRRLAPGDSSSAELLERASRMGVTPQRFR